MLARSALPPCCIALMLDEAERAEKALDVTPKLEPVAVEAKPNPDDEGIDGELADVHRTIRPYPAECVSVPPDPTQLQKAHFCDRHHIASAVCGASLILVDCERHVRTVLPEDLAPRWRGFSLRRSTSCVERTKKAPPASGAQGNRQPMRFSGCGLKRLPST